MLDFDLSKVIQDAASETTREQEYKYKILYPSQGSLTVKLLFNPKSGLVKRLVNRHYLGENRVPCMKTWGQECPICKALSDIEAMKGINLGKMRSIPRGVSYAQYVTSNYKVEGISAGDVVLLMYPWVVYKDFGTIISQAKTEADVAQLIASNEGFVIDIVRDNNQYSAKINPFARYKSASSEEEFVNLLNSIDSLLEAVLPAQPDDSIRATVNAAAQELWQTYARDYSINLQEQKNPISVDQVVPTPNMNPINLNPYQTISQTHKPATPPMSPSGAYQESSRMTISGDLDVSDTNKTTNQSASIQSQTTEYNQTNNPSQPKGSLPECYGKYNEVDKNKCLLCPVEVTCSDASRSNGGK